MFFQEGIAYLRELKYLQTLDMKMLNLSAESIKNAFCKEDRPTLLTLCLPAITIEKEVMALLIKNAPKIKHLCMDEKVRTFIFFPSYLIKLSRMNIHLHCIIYLKLNILIHF